MAVHNTTVKAKMISTINTSTIKLFELLRTCVLTIKKSTTAEESSAATAEESSAATTGESSAATTGESSAATTGESSAAITGESSAATTGESSAATSVSSTASTTSNTSTSTSTTSANCKTANGLDIASSCLLLYCSVLSALDTSGSSDRHTDSLTGDLHHALGAAVGAGIGTGTGTGSGASMSSVSGKSSNTSVSGDKARMLEREEEENEFPGSRIRGSSGSDGYSSACSSSGNLMLCSAADLRSIFSTLRFIFFLALRTHLDSAGTEACKQCDSTSHTVSLQPPESLSHLQLHSAPTSTSPIELFESFILGVLEYFCCPGFQCNRVFPGFQCKIRLNAELSSRSSGHSLSDETGCGDDVFSGGGGGQLGSNNCISSVLAQY